ncbi:hypothetical protein C8F01DRAFT_1274996 [Mycena amicta]|nr:hypothetical protein C8F01DRAFT_1274996 [Mycena amicta]
MRAPGPHSFTPHRLYRAPSGALNTLLSLSTLLLFSVQTNAALINTTYDDSTASFKWQGHWAVVGPTNPCTACDPPVDIAQVQGQTWHAGIFAVNLLSATAGTFTFTGTAVYIYGIDQVNIQADIQFTLGDTVTTHRYTGSEPLVYHSLFFSMTGLAADQIHVVSWNFIAAPTNVAQQEGLFDYAVVTSEGDEGGTSSAKSAIAPSKATSISTESSLTSSASSQTSEGPTPGSTEMPDSVIHCRRIDLHLRLRDRQL